MFPFSIRCGSSIRLGYSTPFNGKSDGLKKINLIDNEFVFLCGVQSVPGVIERT